MIIKTVDLDLKKKHNYFTALKKINLNFKLVPAPIPLKGNFNVVTVD
jgi:hypothetical protein